MIVANNSKLKLQVNPAPFNAGNRRIMCVSRVNYLEIILDSEMELEPLYKNYVGRLSRNYLCCVRYVNI